MKHAISSLCCYIFFKLLKISYHISCFLLNILFPTFFSHLITLGLHLGLLILMYREIIPVRTIYRIINAKCHGLYFSIRLELIHLIDDMLK